MFYLVLTFEEKSADAKKDSGAGEERWIGKVSRKKRKDQSGLDRLVGDY